MLVVWVIGFFAVCASGLRKNATTSALGACPRLVLPKSTMNGTFNGAEASHDIFNTSLASTFMNSTGFKEDPYWMENWWKDASRNHAPARNLRRRWQSDKPLKNDPEEFMPVDESKRRVIFLFLINDEVYFPSHWNAFFEGTDTAQWAAYVHCKQHCSPKFLSSMPALKPVDTVPTYYCHNLVDAMVSLLKGALADGGTRFDKFVFISGSTLPVKPFNEVWHVLGRDDGSDICIFPRNHWGEASFNNQHAVLVKHHQWVTLNYDHAKTMVATWGSVDSQGQWSVPIRTPTYSEPLIYNAETFSRSPIANWCADEWAFFATLFGAIPEGESSTISIPGYLNRNSGNSFSLTGPGTEKQQGKCRTFVFWSEFDDDTTLLAKNIAKGYPHNVLSCWPSCTYRPAVIEKLSNDGLLEMRRSPFLFARKFSKEIKLTRFREIILVKDPPPAVGAANRKVNTSDWDMIHDTN
jgi:hypothetical protein